MNRIQREQLSAIRDYIYANFGIHVSRAKTSFLLPKIEKLLLREKYGTMEELYENLMAGDQEARETLARYVTTNHTFFFREADHFDFLTAMVREMKPSTSLNIWCSACSTGEEPYTIAISLHEAGFPHFRILASDIDQDALHQFNEGLYNLDRFTKMSKYLKQKYFTERKDGLYVIDQRLRSQVKIKRLNLMDSLTFDVLFDFIFCRNVFIYFDDESRSRAIRMMTRNLKIGGCLFIGHTETLFVLPPELIKVGHSIYQRVR